ncbi:hypothetical protein L1887_59941 [Cichorium endivia]|nr:hypothetical protein L1887_59941 [Cichorium endivia]
MSADETSGGVGGGTGRVALGKGGVARGDALEQVGVEEDADTKSERHPLADNRVTDNDGPAAHEAVQDSERRAASTDRNGTYARRGDLGIDTGCVESRAGERAARRRDGLVGLEQHEDGGLRDVRNQVDVAGMRQGKLGKKRRDGRRGGGTKDGRLLYDDLVGRGLEGGMVTADGRLPAEDCLEDLLPERTLGRRGAGLAGGRAVGERAGGRRVRVEAEVGAELGLAEAALDLDAVHLDHDGEDGDVEGKEEDAVEEEDECGELTELAKAADAAGGADSHDGDLDEVVADDGHADAIDGGDDDLVRGRRGGFGPAQAVLVLETLGEGAHEGLLAGDGGSAVGGCGGGLAERADVGLGGVVEVAEDELGALLGGESVGGGGDVGVGEDGAGEQVGFLEADEDDQEGERLGEADGIDGDAEEVGKGDGEKEGEDGGHEDGSAEPKVAAKLAHGEEEVDKGAVHEDVGREHDEDVGRVCLLEESPEADDERLDGVGHPTDALDLFCVAGGTLALEVVGSVGVELAVGHERDDAEAVIEVVDLGDGSLGYGTGWAGHGLDGGCERVGEQRGVDDLGEEFVAQSLVGGAVGGGGGISEGAAEDEGGMLRVLVGNEVRGDVLANEAVGEVGRERGEDGLFDLSGHVGFPGAGHNDGLDEEGGRRRIEEGGGVVEALLCALLSEVAERLPEVGVASLADKDGVDMAGHGGAERRRLGLGVLFACAGPLEETRGGGAGSEAGGLDRDGLEEVGMCDSMEELEVGERDDDEDGDNDLDGVLGRLPCESAEHDLGQGERLGCEADGRGAAAVRGSRCARHGGGGWQGKLPLASG